MTRIPRPALGLGLVGLVPFYALGALSLVPHPTFSRWGLVGFAVYAAVILSFLGGARWGLELARAPDRPSPTVLVLSVVPSLVGWALAMAALLGVMQVGIAGGFAAAFAAQFVWDSRSPTEANAPGWYPALRQILTLGVLISCLLPGVAVALN